MQISVIIPLLNEQDSLPELHQRIQQVMQTNQYTYEILFVDDGSTDDSWGVIKQLSKQDANIKALKFAQNYGKSQALDCAFALVKGNVVVTMDADLQDFPEEIPKLYNKIVVDGFDLVSGWKQNRKDNQLSKNIPSKLFNWVARKTSKIPLHDFNCGLKAYQKEVVKSIRLHSDMHRYIPVLAKYKGFQKITEVKVQHTARKFGKSKFGSRRFIYGFLDLLTLSFIGKFGNKPMHLFGTFGTIMFLVGLFAAMYIGAEKLYIVLYLKQSARLVTENPFFYIALSCMVIGSQLFLAGFLGEILVRLKSKQSVRILEQL